MSNNIDKNFKAIISNIDEDKRVIAKALYKELLFIEKSMNECKSNIQEVGIIEWFEQGKQKFHKESAGSQTYIKYARLYNQTLKQLTELIPEEVKEEKDELLEFLGAV